MRSIRFVILLIGILSLPLLLEAQTPRLLRFDAPVKELDTIREVDGPIKLRYEFTNISDKPVTLLEVHTQCGCLQPTYDHKPVAPGGRGVVHAVFDPKNRMGAFSIGLTVIAMCDQYKKFNTLKASGYVVNRIPEEEIFYPYLLSTIFRADVDAVGMRRFRPGDGPRTRQIKLFNTTQKPLRPTYRSGNPHLRMTGPAEIAPRSEAIVVYEFDPRGVKPGHFTIPTIVLVANTETKIEIRGLIDEK